MSGCRWTGDEETRHDQARDSVVEVDSGEALTRMAGGVEEHVEVAIERQIARALELRYHPDALALTRLTDRLLTSCATAADVEQILESEPNLRGRVALETWQQLRPAAPKTGRSGPGPMPGTSGWSPATRCTLSGTTGRAAARS
jgi:hypothetical protein